MLDNILMTHLWGHSSSSSLSSLLPDTPPPTERHLAAITCISCVNSLKISHECEERRLGEECVFELLLL